MFKSRKLKKNILCSVVLLIIGFSYVYQKPILTTEEAKDSAMLCMNVPPKDSGLKSGPFYFDDISSEKLSIDKKSGFYNQITNQRELSVTLHTKSGEVRKIRMDAYSGKCLKITDPQN